MSQAAPAELRIDRLAGRSVIVAENRALRPNEFATQAATPRPATNLTLAEVGLDETLGLPGCPFCPGNESDTPPAVYQQLDDEQRWRVRVVPNKFPAVALGTSAAAAQADSAVAAALGAHEVIIECPRHLERTSELTEEELRDVLVAYAQRLRYWRRDGRFAYGLVFKNQGPAAGASIAHLHSQLLALATVPPAVDAEARRAEHDYRQHRACPYCRLIDEERTAGVRIVVDRDGYVAFCPRASLQPYEVWLLPGAHQPWFDEPAATASIDRLAGVLHALLRRIEPTVRHGAFNLMLRCAPWQPADSVWCHWRLELLPRHNALAALELATGLHINPIAPERAAAQLRPI